jgi:hypothetical protein
VVCTGNREAAPTDERSISIRNGIRMLKNTSNCQPRFTVVAEPNSTLFCVLRTAVCHLCGDHWVLGHPHVPGSKCGTRCTHSTCDSSIILCSKMSLPFFKVAIVLFESVNYVEHYGLERHVDPSTGGWKVSMGSEVFPFVLC